MRQDRLNPQVFQRSTHDGPDPWRTGLINRLSVAARWRRYLAWSLIIGGPLIVYCLTLLPGIGYGDTAEFQRVTTTLGLAHVTGYPLYTLLGWLWSHLPLGGSAAWRINLLSAVLGALSLGTLYSIGRRLGQRRLVAVVLTLTFAFSLTFWLESTHAEVYALSTLLLSGLIYALLSWRAGELPLWVAALVLGLGLAHHRTILLLTPGALLFVLLTRRPAWPELLRCIPALLLPGLLYLYIPLQAQPWEDPSQLLKRYLLADVAQGWLKPQQLLADGWRRPLGIVRQLVWPMLTPLGLPLAGLGAWRVLRRDRALATLLLLSYLIYFGFCAAYYVPDLEVFLLPCHLIMAMLFGEGLMLLTDRWPPLVRATPLLLGLPIVLIVTNLPTLRQHSSSAPEEHARSLMGEPMAPGALVILEPYLLEGPRYLQAVEGIRPDLEFRFSPDRDYITAALQRDRAVYVQQPVLELGLNHTLSGRMWQIQPEPLAAAATTPISVQWAGGLQLVRSSAPATLYRPGSGLALGLAWQTDTPLPAAYITFIHLEDAQGTLWGQVDRPPTLATDQWPVAIAQTELYALPLDPHIPPGRYTVRIGWYDPATLQRLPLAAGSGDAFALAEIEVVDR